MSKSKRNYTEINDVLDQMGADSMRLYFLSSPIVHGEEVIFNEKFLKEVMTSIMLPFWNSVKYLLSYKEDLSKIDELKLENVMDRWIVAELNTTVEKVNSSMDLYDLQSATKAIAALIDDLSKWYIRRCRERFVSGDKDALDTLQSVLLEISKLLAPFAPFLSETAFQTLSTYDNKESVHLEDYLISNEVLLNDGLLNDMANIRTVCSLGLNIRDENRLKVRQPLAKAYVPVESFELQEIVKGELNVKDVEYSEKEVEGDGLVSQSDGKIFVTLDTKITKELKEEGLLNEIIRGLQVARKENGCQVGERIAVDYSTSSDDLDRLIGSYKQKLQDAVLANSFTKTSLENGVQIKVADAVLVVRINTQRG
jgi:isoleucyl-tRNA synthetase